MQSILVTLLSAVCICLPSVTQMHACDCITALTRVKGAFFTETHELAFAWETCILTTELWAHANMFIKNDSEVTHLHESVCRCLHMHNPEAAIIVWNKLDPSFHPGTYARGKWRSFLHTDAGSWMKCLFTSSSKMTLDFLSEIVFTSELRPAVDHVPAGSGCSGSRSACSTGISRLSRGGADRFQLLSALVNQQNSDKLMIGRQLFSGNSREEEHVRVKEPWCMWIIPEIGSL